MDEIKRTLCFAYLNNEDDFIVVSLDCAGTIVYRKVINSLAEFYKGDRMCLHVMQSVEHESPEPEMNIHNFIPICKFGNHEPFWKSLDMFDTLEWANLQKHVMKEMGVA